MRRKTKISDPISSGNGLVDVHVMRPEYGTGAGLPVTFSIHHRKMPDDRAKFAMECIGRWAVVAADIDGEDSAGRAKVRRMTASEIASHACECASAAFDEFDKRGWMISLPSIADAIDSVKDQENGND